MKCSLGISHFLEESLVFPILLFSSISLHWSLRKAFLPLLAILWNFAFKWVYLSFTPLPFTSLLFTAICKTSLTLTLTLILTVTYLKDNHFAFLDIYCLPQWTVQKIKENNRMEKTRDLFKKIDDIKGTFHERMGTIKDRNDKAPTEAEDSKKRWQEYTEELYKKRP